MVVLEGFLRFPWEQIVIGEGARASGNSSPLFKMLRAASLKVSKSTS